MADIREAVMAALLADSGVSSVVHGRVFALVVPAEEAMPSIVVQLVSLVRPRGLTRPFSIVQARVQITAVGQRPSDNAAIALAVRNCLHAYTGNLGGLGLIVTSSTAADEQDLFADPADGTGQGIVRTALDYVLCFREPLPTRFTT